MSGRSWVTHFRRCNRAIVLGTILLLALALRLVGARYGLPYPLLNPDEASIVPRAWRMGHEGHLDPGVVRLPLAADGAARSRAGLLHEPSYEAARAAAILIGVGGVAATWWLGRRAVRDRAAIVGAAAVAVSTTHIAYSRVAVTDVLLTLAITLALALALDGRLGWAGLAVGLAASAKYPGVLAAAPVLVAGWGRWRSLGRGAVLAVTAFAVTSPFVVLHARAAWHDISHVQRLARDGWLGFEQDPATPIALLDRAWQALGPLLVLAAVAIVVALVRRARSDLVLLTFVAVYLVYLLPLNAHFDRYVLPLVPVLAVLAGSIRLTVPVALVLLVVPLVWSVGDARRADPHRYPDPRRCLDRRQRPAGRQDRG